MMYVCMRLFLARPMLGVEALRWYALGLCAASIPFNSCV